MKVKIAIISIAVVFLSSYRVTPLVAQPGVSDVLSRLLKNINGFSTWVSHPTYIERPVNLPVAHIWHFPTYTQHDRFAFSLKYDVYSFGDSTIFPDFTATPVEEDHDVTGSVNRDPSRAGKDTIIEAIEKKWSFSLFNSVKKRENVSLNFGFSYSSPVTLETIEGFSTTFPYSGFFVAGVYTITFGHFDSLNSFLYDYHSGQPSNDSQFTHAWRMALGVQANFYSLSGVNADFRDPSSKIDVPLNFTSALTLSPEVFVGIATRLGPNASFFVDADYQFNQIGSLAFTPVSSSDQNFSSIFTKLPKSFNLDNWQIKMGLSITIPNLSGASTGSSSGGSSNGGATGAASPSPTGSGVGHHGK